MVRSRILVLGALGASQIALPLRAQDYPSEPLRVQARAPASSPVAIGRFLTENGGVLSQAQAAAVREDLFAHITFRLRRAFAQTGHQYPTPTDSVLAGLFQLASRAGAVGARAVANSMLPGLVAPEELPRDSGLTLSYEAPEFRLRDERLGWELSFPFYFMISAVSRQTLADGNAYAVVMLSTLDAPNAPPDTASSQATVLVVAAAIPASALAAFWSPRLAVQLSQAPSPSSRADGLYFTGTDSSARLRKELLVLPSGSGAVGIAYIGLEGTFQSNRPHYIEVLHRLRTRAVPSN